MIKFTTILVVVLVMEFLHASEDSPKDPWEYYGSIDRMCIQELNVTKEDEKSWMNGDTDSRKLKCLEACIAEKKGELIDNKINTTTMEKYMQHIEQSDTLTAENKAILKDVIHECNSIKVEDKCEVYGKVKECMDEKFLKRSKK